MATIRNSISMTDRMTPTLRSILRAMDSTLTVMKQLDKAANNGVQSKAYKRAEKDIQRANNALIKMRNYTQMASSAAAQGERSYSRMGSAASAVASGFDKIGDSASYFLQSLASGVYLAQKLANVVEDVMTTGDTSRSQVARLGLYNTSEHSNEELYGRVFSTAMSTRTGLNSTADLINKLLVSGVFDAATATSSAMGTAGLINKALVAGGGTSEENERALTQLTQGLSSGVLQGDELRTIREQTPYLAQMLAKGLGEVDERFEGIGIGDLKALGAAGELTSDVVVKAFWAMQDEINKDFESMPKTFGQAMTSLSNIWQYFLWLLSGADAPLGKINEKLWQFVDYLQSPQGLELLNTVAIGANLITTALTETLGMAGEFVMYLRDNAPVAQALFIALGAAAAVAGLKAAASWIAATWPILLIASIMGIVAYQFLKAGYTAQQVVGAIVGGVLWVAAVIWDTVLGIVAFVGLLVAVIIEIVLGIVWLVIFVIQLIAQAVLWIILSVWTAIEAIGLAIATVFMTIWGGIQTVLGWIENGVYTCFSGVLSGLQIVADAIDAVLGTSLGDTVSSWTTGLDDIHATVSGFLDADKTFTSIEDMWTAFGERTAARYGEDSEWTITDNMKDVAGVFGGAMEGVWDWTNEDFGETVIGAMWDPSQAYDSGYEWGAGLVTEIEGMNLGIPDGSELNGFDPNSVTVNGGYLDGINSDVNIGDEDIQLLRDMAAREFLLNVQTVTPTLTVTFGDVRETADVNVIMDKLEQMVEEQLATSLVD